MVFYPGPLGDHALKRKGMSEHASIQDRWKHLTLEYITNSPREPILSLIDIPVGESVYNFILESV